MNQVRCKQTDVGIARENECVGSTLLQTRQKGDIGHIHVQLFRYSSTTLRKLSETHVVSYG